MTLKLKIFYWFLFISSSLGFCLSYFPGLGGKAPIVWLHELIELVSYFTILSNLTITLLSSSQLFFSQSRLGLFLSSMTVQTAIAVYITITAVVFHILLSDTYHPEGLNIISNFLNHTLTPILYVVFWWFCVRGKAMSFKKTFPVLMLPTVFLGYWLVRGPIVGEYPYFFLDVDKFGYGVVLFNSIGLCLAFWLVGAFYWSLSKFTTPLYV